jgi:23S rRNA (adenine2030-N6)-methyltransferase
MGYDYKRYDHSSHAGNAGDVWKHFILAEVAEHLLSRGQINIYLESHAGYPDYSLQKHGEWTGGIGRYWKKLSKLKRFCYFDLLAEVNPEGLERYLGSSSITLKIAERCGKSLSADLWDIHPDVGEAWRGRPGIKFHHDDGFSGVRALIGRSRPALLLVDPPYVYDDDSKKALDLAIEALEARWVVLWWQMTAAKPVLGSLSPFEEYYLDFNMAGLDCGRWRGTSVFMAGADADLIGRIDSSLRELTGIIRQD